MRIPKRRLPLGPGLVLLACCRVVAAPDLPAFVGLPAPDFALRDANGRLHTLRSHRGEIVVLSFWALWCDTWKTETQRLARLRRRLGGTRFASLAISVDARWPERVVAEGSERKVRPLLWDMGGEVSARYGIQAVPTIIIVDDRGIIRYRHRGPPGADQLIAEVRAAAAPLDESSARIALTFDDFPQDCYTGELLDVLARERVRATFFAIGRNVQRHPDLVRRAAAQGHTLGNHSYSHHRLDDLSDARLRQELQRTNRLLTSLVGSPPRWFRPPGESKHPHLQAAAEECGMKVVHWSVDPYDTSRPGAAAIVERVLARARPDAVVLLHCGVHDTVAALPLLIRCLRVRGYRFVSLDELPASNSSSHHQSVH